MVPVEDVVEVVEVLLFFPFATDKSERRAKLLYQFLVLAFAYFHCSPSAVCVCVWVCVCVCVCLVGISKLEVVKSQHKREGGYRTRKAECA